MTPYITLTSLLTLPLISCLVTKFPAFPDQFTMTYEHVNPTKRTVFSQREYYDFGAQLVRFDMIPEPQTELRKRFSARPLKVVWDFTVGHQYVIDRRQYNCTMTLIPDGNFPSVNVGLGHVQMQLAIRWIQDVQDIVVRLPHKQMIRGILADVYELKKADHTYHKVMYMDANWRSTSDVSRKAWPQPLVSMEHYTNESMTNLIYKTNIIDFSPEHPENDVFDVGLCFTWASQYQLVLRIQGDYKKDITMNKFQVYTAIRKKIALMAQISPLRITSLGAYMWESNSIHVFFTMRGIPAIGNVDTPNVVTPNLTTAYNTLGASMQTWQSVDVSYPTGIRKLRFIPKSLMKQSDLYKSRSKPYGYTAGSMAGLGIGMLFIGCVFGLIAAAVIYKKFNTKIPYQLTT